MTASFPPPLASAAPAKSATRRWPLRPKPFLLGFALVTLLQACAAVSLVGTAASVTTTAATTAVGAGVAVAGAGASVATSAAKAAIP